MTDELNITCRNKKNHVGKTTFTLEDCGEKMEDDEEMGIFPLKRGDFSLSKPPKPNGIISF